MESKREILSQLYTLRAGLSWISQNKRQIDSLQYSVIVPTRLDKHKLLADNNNEVGNLEKQLNGLGDEEVKERSDVSSKLYDAQMSVARIIVGIVTWILAAALLCVALLGLYIVLAYYSWHLEEEWCTQENADHIGSPIMMIGFVAFAVIFYFAIAFVVIAIKDRRVVKQSKLQLQQITEKYKLKKQDLESRLQKAKQARENGVQNINERYDTREREIAKAKQKIEDIRQNQILPLLKSSLQFYNLLVSVYGDALDVRDWEYLDLVIYYVETNRAVSIREALQLIDRERQTQQIVGSVRLAAETICRTIQNEMFSLRGTIEQGYLSLQHSLETGFATVSDKLDTSNALLQLQIDQTMLTNALLAHANVTSEQLISNVNSLRRQL